MFFSVVGTYIIILYRIDKDQLIEIFMTNKKNFKDGGEININIFELIVSVIVICVTFINKP